MESISQSKVEILFIDECGENVRKPEGYGLHTRIFSSGINKTMCAEVLVIVPPYSYDCRCIGRFITICVALKYSPAIKILVYMCIKMKLVFISLNIFSFFLYIGQTVRTFPFKVFCFVSTGKSSGMKTVEASMSYAHSRA